jgi:hypothetical protein
MKLRQCQCMASGKESSEKISSKILRAAQMTNMLRTIFTKGFL